MSHCWGGLLKGQTRLVNRSIVAESAQRRGGRLRLREQLPLTATAHRRGRGCHWLGSAAIVGESHRLYEVTRTHVAA